MRLGRWIAGDIDNAIVMFGQWVEHEMEMAEYRLREKAGSKKHSKTPSYDQIKAERERVWYRLVMREDYRVLWSPTTGRPFVKRRPLE